MAIYSSSPPATILAQETAGLTGWWRSETAQQWLIERPIRIAIIVVVALVLHWLLRRMITKLAQHNIDTRGGATGTVARLRRRKAARAHTTRSAALGDAQEKRRQSRVKTLAAVGRSAVAIVVWVWAGLAILSEIGVNIAPLIASAGVVGVAIGFGAQSLVKDFLSGIFMLLEDQYGVGDTIDVGDGIVGDVEDISLRLTTIRDIDGTLWYVRNGEILRIGNFSDEYSIARIQVPVGLSNDSEKAWRVIEDSVNRAVKESPIDQVVLEEPIMNGVTDFAVDHISYRISVKTLPGKQWDVQRFLQLRVLSDMQANGITTPYPHGIGIAVPEAE